MHVSWIVLIVSLSVVLGMSSLVILRGKRKAYDWESDADWADNFTIEKYNPMKRLLRPEDRIFLRSQPGYHPSLEKSLLKDRRRIFRSYMKSLRLDFDRLYFAAKQLVLYSESDQSALLQVLVRQRAVFYFALGLVECRLALHAAGVGTVDVSPLVGALESMRDAVRILEPTPSMA